MRGVPGRGAGGLVPVLTLCLTPPRGPGSVTRLPWAVPTGGDGATSRPAHSGDESVRSHGSRAAAGRDAGILPEVPWASRSRLWLNPIGVRRPVVAAPSLWQRAFQTFTFKKQEQGRERGARAAGLPPAAWVSAGPPQPPRRACCLGRQLSAELAERVTVRSSVITPSDWEDTRGGSQRRV